MERLWWPLTIDPHLTILSLQWVWSGPTFSHRGKRSYEFSPKSNWRKKQRITGMTVIESESTPYHDALAIYIYNIYIGRKTMENTCGTVYFKFEPFTNLGDRTIFTWNRPSSRRFPDWLGLISPSPTHGGLSFEGWFLNVCWVKTHLSQNVIYMYIYIYPICSMYGIFTNIYPINHPNVGKYTIHGAYGCIYIYIHTYVSPP